MAYCAVTDGLQSVTVYQQKRYKYWKYKVATLSSLQNRLNRTMATRWQSCPENKIKLFNEIRFFFCGL